MGTKNTKSSAVLTMKQQSYLRVACLKKTLSVLTHSLTNELLDPAQVSIHLVTMVMATKLTIMMNVITGLVA